jgi:hypothetical protein
MTETTATTHISQQMRECIQRCTDCHNVCTETITYCLEQGGAYAALDLVRLLQDCAQLCTTSADSMLRASSFSGPVCGLCAIVCDACAEACDQFGDDPQMKACADTCRRCAECCRRMAG